MAAQWEQEELSSYLTMYCNVQTKPNAGLKITASQRTMSDQNGDLTGQKLHSPVMLTDHVTLRGSRCSFLSKQSNPQL